MKRYGSHNPYLHERPAMSINTPGEEKSATRFELSTDDLDSYQSFLDESSEHLGDMEQKILEMEEGGGSDLINDLFRTLHSIKGVASFLGLQEIQQLSHQMESVFDRLRKETL